MGVISWQAPTQFEVDLVQYCRMSKVAENKYCMVYYNTTLGIRPMIARIFEIQPDGTETWGAEYQICPNGSSIGNAVCYIEDNKLLFTYMDANDANNGYCVIGTVVGNVITFHVSLKIRDGAGAAGIYQFMDPHSTRLTTSQAVVIFDDHNYYGVGGHQWGYRIVNISGNTLTNGVFRSGNTYGNPSSRHPFVTRINDTHFLWNWYNAGNQIVANIADSSGNVGTRVVTYTSGTYRTPGQCIAIDETRIIQPIGNNAPACRVKIMTIDVATLAITDVGTPIELAPCNGCRYPSSALIDAAHFCINTGGWDSYYCSFSGTTPVLVDAVNVFPVSPGTGCLMVPELISAGTGLGRLAVGHEDGNNGYVSWGDVVVIPTATTLDATVPAILAPITFNGELTDDGGEACTCYFEYGTDPAVLGSFTANQAGKTTGDSIYEVMNLAPGTWYYKLCATNSAGTDCGVIKSFVVPSTAPAGTAAVAILPVTAIGESRATLNGYVMNSLYRYGRVRFEYGLTTEYGMVTPWQDGKITGDEFSALITGLRQGTMYHARAVLEINPKAVSGDISFITGEPQGPVVWATDDFMQAVQNS